MTHHLKLVDSQNTNPTEPKEIEIHFSKEDSFTRYVPNWEDASVVECNYKKLDDIYSIDQFGLKMATQFCNFGFTTWQEAKDSLIAQAQEELDKKLAEIEDIKQRALRVQALVSLI